MATLKAYTFIMVRVYFFRAFKSASMLMSQVFVVQKYPATHCSDINIPKIDGTWTYTFSNHDINLILCWCHSRFANTFQCGWPESKCPMHEHKAQGERLVIYLSNCSPMYYVESFWKAPQFSRGTRNPKLQAFDPSHHFLQDCHS